MEIASVVVGILMLCSIETKKVDKEPHWTRNIVVVCWILAATMLILVPIIFKK